jgi:hypothetical protein
MMGRTCAGRRPGRAWQRVSRALAVTVVLAAVCLPAAPPSAAARHRSDVAGRQPQSVTSPSRLPAQPSDWCPDDALFCEHFDDTAFADRGWYDGPRGDVSAQTRGPESTGALRCTYQRQERGCQGGTPGRHLFGPSESVYLEYWVRYGAGFVGSGRPYHPHEFNILTNKDGPYIGPAGTHLTTYVEQLAGVPRLALQDMLNVDLGCILRNDDSIVGCNGDFATYEFTENRSVASCNGLQGDVDKRDCFQSDATHWYSARAWDAPSSTNLYDDRWHLVAALFRMNSISGGVGQVDGALRYWMDGELVLSSDRILFRTDQNADMMFNQLLIAPYIGDGSPVEQTMWIDDMRLLVNGDGVVPEVSTWRLFFPLAPRGG